jgi:multidrug resistance efflux pump
MSTPQNSAAPTPAPAAAVASAPAPGTNAPNPKRRKALTALAAVVVVAGLGWTAYEWLVASHYETTDNAYVQGNVIQITPQISGTVLAIMADDTDFVKAGQPLVKLDPADARLALDQAEANLAQTVRQVRTLYEPLWAYRVRTCRTVCARLASAWSSARRWSATALCRRKNSTTRKRNWPTRRARWHQRKPALLRPKSSLPATRR